MIEYKGRYDLNMEETLEQLLDEATLAVEAGNEQKGEQLLDQLARSSDPGVIDVMVKTLRGGGTKLRQALAIRVLHLLGYPKNEPAIADLIYHLGDPNLPGWREAAVTLRAIEVAVLTPYLVRALLDQDAALQFGKSTYSIWGSNVEGVCYWLTQVEGEYTRLCYPAIIYLLSQAELLQRSDAPDINVMLDVLEKADVHEEYIILTLIALAKKHHEDFIGTHAQLLLATFKQEALAPYKLYY